MISSVPAIEISHVSKEFVLVHEQSRAPRHGEKWPGRHSARRDPFWALNDVTFDVAPGETVGLIGTNGSGKSTLLKLIARILEPSRGHIVARGRVAAMLELGAGFHHELSGRDNVYLNASLLGVSHAEIDRLFGHIIEFAELERFVDTPVKHYSSGMYARLAFSISIHIRPDILLIDEVLSVGDQSFQAKCMTQIYDIRNRGTTVVLVSHDLSTVQALCDRVIWLDKGKVQMAARATDAVMAYLNYMARRTEFSGSRYEASELTASQRWGTGRARITRVELCDSRGNPVQAFVTGAAMEIRLHYHADEPVKDPVFGLAVYHQSGTHIAGPNTAFAGLHIPSISGDGVVSYRIPALALLEGTYHLSVAVVNREDTVTYDFQDRAYPLRVFPGGTRERYGLMTLQGTWQADASGAEAVAEPALVRLTAK